MVCVLYVLPLPLQMAIFWRQHHQLKELISFDITLDVTGTPDSFSQRLDSRSVVIAIATFSADDAECSYVQLCGLEEQVIICVQWSAVNPPSPPTDPCQPHW